MIFDASYKGSGIFYRTFQCVPRLCEFLGVVSEDLDAATCVFNCLRKHPYVPLATVTVLVGSALPLGDAAHYESALFQETLAAQACANE